jgi:hypothetical protein
MKLYQRVILAILAFVAFCFIIYGLYWLVKTLSYFFFYEDMVQKTIIEMVKPEALKLIK